METPKEEMCFRKVKQARRDIEINKKKDQDRERDMELHRKSNESNNRHNSREKAEVTEVETMEDIVEDFEDGTPPRGGAKHQSGPAQLKSQEVRGRSSVTNRKEGFGMSDADFLDADEPTTARSNQSIRNGPDNSMSPPLFKEMRAGDGYDSEASPKRANLGQGGMDRDRERDRTTGQSLVHGNLAHTTHGGGKESTTGSSGWTTGASAGIAATAGSGQGNAVRRSDDFDARERERERDTSNLRGRNTNTGGDFRGNNANSNAGGRGDGDGRGNGGRDGRDNMNNQNNRGRELSRDGNRDTNNFNRGRDASRDGRDPRLDNNNHTTAGEKGAWSRLEEEGQRFNRDSRDTNRDINNRDISRGRADTRDQDWRRDSRNTTNATHTTTAQSGRPSSASNATHVSTSIHNADHVTERERELKVEVQKYQEDVRKLTDDNTELADKLGE